MISGFMQRIVPHKHLSIVNLRYEMLFLCAILAGAAFAERTLSLEDCVKLAREQSLDMESAKLSERASEASLQSAKASGRPTVSAYVRNTLYDTPFDGQSQDHYRFSMGLSGSYTLWDGGSTRINVESKQLSLEASKYSTELAALNVQESAMNAFVNLLAAQEDLETSDSALVLSDSVVSYHERLYEAGSITRSDLALVKSDAANAKVKQISAAQAERSAMTTLRQVLEFSRSDSLKIVAPQARYETPSDMGTLPAFDEVLSETKAHYPGLISDSLKVRAATKDVELASKNSSISVTLGAEASTGFQAWESDRYARQVKNGYTHSLTLGISIPIVDGGTTKAKVLSAQVESERAKVSQRETGKTLENNLEKLYMQAESADASWLAAIAGLESAEEAFHVAAEQRSAGTISFTDFLEQKNNLQSAKSTLTQAKYTSILARSLLDLYMGRF